MNLSEGISDLKEVVDRQQDNSDMAVMIVYFQCGPLPEEFTLARSIILESKQTKWLMEFFIMRTRFVMIIGMWLYQKNSVLHF